MHGTKNVKRADKVQACHDERHDLNLEVEVLEARIAPAYFSAPQTAFWGIPQNPGPVLRLGPEHA